MTALADELGGWRRSEFRRLVAISTVAHLLGGLLLAMTPTWSTSPAMPEVIAVDLVMAPPAPGRRPAPAPQARPAPAPEAAPAPAPEPVPAPAPLPVEKKIILPEEAALPKPKPQERPKPAPAPRRRELDPSELQQPREAPQQYEDVLAQLRAEADEPAEAAPAAEPQAAPSPAPSAASSGRPVPPEIAAWIKRVRVHVSRNWPVPPGFRTQMLETEVMVTLGPDGTILGEPELVRGSGNYHYDDNVMRGLRKASPLPPHPRGATEATLSFPAWEAF